MITALSFPALALLLVVLALVDGGGRFRDDVAGVFSLCLRSLEAVRGVRKTTLRVVDDGSVCGAGFGIFFLGISS